MKHKFKFTQNAWNYNNTRLTNQIFKLLPMYEEDEEWQKQQETVILELYGYNEMFSNNPSFMTLIAKLAALNYAEDKFTFRKLIFEAITCLKEIKI